MAQATIMHSGPSVLLYDSAFIDSPDPRWFEPGYWESRGAVIEQLTGRGSVRIVRHESDRWVLRHYHRGGIVARLIEDHYLWLGLRRTRAYREWHLLAELWRLGLPVPQPIAARITRHGFAYESDIITRYLPATRPLAAYLKEEQAGRIDWSRVGRMLSRFHEHGVCHPDLTAHNILLDATGNPFLVDFDNCRFRPPGRWRDAGMRRLQRSLRKVALESGTQFDAAAWDQLETAYRQDLGSPL